MLVFLTNRDWMNQIEDFGKKYNTIVYDQRYGPEAVLALMHWAFDDPKVTASVTIFEIVIRAMDKREITFVGEKYEEEEDDVML